MKLRVVGLTVIAAAAFCAQALAHHSFTMFDKERNITITGTLKELEWTNPHCWLHVTTTDPATGKTVEWSFEMGSISQVVAQGWKVDSVKPGDKVSITGHPLRDGSRGGQYESIKIADGRSFTAPIDPGANAPNV